MSVTRKLIGVLSLTSCMAFSAIHAQAADQGINPGYAPKSTLLFWGGSLRDDAFYAYAGAVHAFNGDLNTDGFLARVFGAFGDYEYRTPAVAGGVVDVDQTSADVMLGYQVHGDTYRASIYAGLNFQDRDQSPVDPTSTVRGSEEGFKVQGELRTNSNAPYFGSLLGSYSTAFETYYTRARVGMDFGGLTVGPEGILLGNEEFDGHRIGAFVSGFRIGDINMTLSGGYADSDNGGGNNGGYFQVGFSTAF